MSDPYKGKYCKDCRHYLFDESSGYVFHRCTAEQGNGKIDPVIGQTPSGYEGCRKRRSADYSSFYYNKCGPEGRLWESKE